jgi:FkbM family methyltransferase
MEYLKLLYRAWKYRLADNPEEIRYLLHTIKRDATVLDVGAHKGGYTFWMRKAVGPQGLVVAFEPQSKGARLLQALFAKTNVRVEHKALSDRVGQQELFIQPQSFTVSFEASLENKYPNVITEQVATTTIDQYCTRHGLRPSFIKIDVEGHEEKVLEGGLNVLRQARPVLLMECELRHSGPQAMERTFSLLNHIHYEGFFFRKGKRTELEQFDPLIDQRTSQAGSKDYVNNFFFEPGPQA